MLAFFGVAYVLTILLSKLLVLSIVQEDTADVKI